MEKTKVGVIGTGTMGSGIAQVAATAGHQTVLFDIDPGMLQKAKYSLQQNLSRLQEKGKMSEEQSKKITANIQFVSSPKEFEGSGLIIEAIVENLDIKKK